MERFTTSDGLSLAYADEGEGVPLLCLAGLTRNMEDFEPLMTARPGAARYIRLDARGRGASDYAEDISTYAVPIEARDVLELMDHLGLQRAALLGTSRGGLIAMALAATVPDRLTGVLFNDIGPALEAEGLGKIMDYIGLPPAASTHAEMAQGLAAYFGGSVTGVSQADWEAQSRRQFTETPGGLALRYDARLRDALLAQRDQPVPDLWPFFEALRAHPVAVLRGAHSDLLSEATVDAMAARHPGMLRATVPGRAHVPFLDEPESLALFDAFLAELSR
ncbi:MAG: alpha/beta hydrolase [Pseudomonadota bacterium]